MRVGCSVACVARRRAPLFQSSSLFQSAIKATLARKNRKQKHSCGLCSCQRSLPKTFVAGKFESGTEAHARKALRENDKFCQWFHSCWGFDGRQVWRRRFSRNFNKNADLARSAGSDKNFNQIIQIENHVHLHGCRVHRCTISQYLFTAINNFILIIRNLLKFAAFERLKIKTETSEGGKGVRFESGNLRANRNNSRKSRNLLMIWFFAIWVVYKANQQRQECEICLSSSLKINFWGSQRTILRIP